MNSEEVMIGVPSMVSNSEASVNCNIVGGDPLLPDSVPWPSCCVCDQPMFFLLRIEAPVDESLFTRLIYMFVCARPGCLRVHPHRCFRVFRINAAKVSCATNDKNHQTPVVLDLDTYHFDEADDWEGCEEEEEACEELEAANNGWALSDSSPRFPQGGTSDKLTGPSYSSSTFSYSRRGNPAFEGGYIDVYAEPFDEEANSKLLSSYERSLLSAYSGADDLDTYLKELYSAASAGDVDNDETAEDGKEEECPDDRLFSKFVKRLHACPEQILRYNWNGKPLFAASADPETLAQMKVCATCGGPSQFELQITPSLFYQMRPFAPEVKATLCDANVATVLVYSCQRSCWTDDSMHWSEEHCFVQRETVVKLEEVPSDEEDKE